jgi:hypothetical protein
VLKSLEGHPELVWSTIQVLAAFDACFGQVVCSAAFAGSTLWPCNLYCVQTLALNKTASLKPRDWCRAGQTGEDGGGELPVVASRALHKLQICAQRT